MSENQQQQAAEAAAQGKLGWKAKVLLFATMVAAFVFLPTTIVILIGMLPTLVTLITDRNPSKSATVTVGSMNAAGVVPALLRLWQQNHSIPGALAVISDYTTVIVMYSAALIGIVIYNNVTPLVSLAVYRRARLRLREIEKRQKLLKEIWGEDVARGH